MFQRHNQELWKKILTQSEMLEYLSFELFVHNKAFFGSSSFSKTRHKDGWGKLCGRESITKNVCLKYDIFAWNSSLKCLVPASETYPGWKKCTKVALCFKCDKEEHTTDYQQQDSLEEKENEEVAGTSEDVELYIYNIFSHSLTYLELIVEIPIKLRAGKGKDS